MSFESNKTTALELFMEATERKDRWGRNDCFRLGKDGQFSVSVQYISDSYEIMITDRFEDDFASHYVDLSEVVDSGEEISNFDGMVNFIEDGKLCEALYLCDIVAGVKQLPESTTNSVVKPNDSVSADTDKLLEFYKKAYEDSLIENSRLKAKMATM